ncbi:hypothetical protein MIMGU_mgv1a021891mg [Erythranthe guttata]|uniref:Phospholipase D n=1 Tax=Erythranthe guttata TaxID=4155 RepID=A0A022Q6G7_ERYGU|nr:hypothetical protein MIMGU_mgv1a021891mg [Erythranthe guttata]
MENNETVYLHGDLDLVIIEVRRIASMEFVSEHVRRFLKHPYIKVYLGEARVARTARVRAHDSQNPVWNEHFEIPLAHPVDQILNAFVSAKKIVMGELIDEWFPVVGTDGTHTAIRLQITFTPCNINPIYANGIAENYAVMCSYFPLRHGGKLTLYQDAHVIDGRLPDIKLGDGKNFEHHKCWEDICHAILEAQNLVYIAGWSIYHKIMLVREPSKPLPNGGDLNLGELLKYKSQQGVRVVLLIWDDKTSQDKCLFKIGGMMQTHDKETRKFFKHSGVTCVCRIIYSQHQKCVIVDAKGHENNRKIIAFLGGLDLCDGRYDTPDHRLYNDIDTIFKNDYHNPTFCQGKKGPRQPWHDLHCRIEGPAAYDVLKNFEQRWKKATECSEFTRICKLILGWHDYILVDIEHISQIASPSGTIPNDHPSLWAFKENDPENWHIQIFRSVDSESVEGFPTNVFAAKEQNLVFEKKWAIDRSIQMAYIQAIRSAQRFIFVENQYFIGSSFAWPCNKKTGANNLIPMELALKIASKIRANERFGVYVIIPMWPEGEPSSSSVQQILYWQRQTMQMMYKIIAEELKSSNVENAHATDYLNFYCLGKRDDGHTQESSNDSASEAFRRFMIYVHSKGMIVDDEYIIIGSANINQRSMAGHRDVEIAMGAYQPHYTWIKKKEHPLGQVYGYRMSLWAEHLGCIENCFKDPQNLECVKYINNVAEDNWKKYTAEEYSPLQGHILKYPVKIEADGKINPLPGHNLFPDVGGRVLGSMTILPDVITT